MVLFKRALKQGYLLNVPVLHMLLGIQQALTKCLFRCLDWEGSREGKEKAGMPYLFFFFFIHSPRESVVLLVPHSPFRSEKNRQCELTS